MFKKGQLVRSKNTGALYVVGLPDYPNLLVLGRVQPDGRVNSYSYRRGHSRNLELIGNNYKAK